MTKKVMVLMGGFSSEREVSLVSGKSVSNALRKKDYIVVEHDLTDTKKLLAALDAEKPDVVFNALHGNWSRTLLYAACVLLGVLWSVLEERKKENR